MKLTAKQLLLQAGFGLLKPTDLVKSKINHPLKSCLWCGDMHRHNNSFCSTECCRKWQAKRRTDLHSK